MSIKKVGPVNNYSPSESFEGFTLFSPMSGHQVWLIDMAAQFVHYWDVENEPGALI